MDRWIGRIAFAMVALSCALLVAAVALPAINPDWNGIALLLMVLGVLGCLLTILAGHGVQVARLLHIESAISASVRTPIVTAYIALAVWFALLIGGNMPRLRETFGVEEAKAIGAVRATIQAQTAYKKAYPQMGFACTLRELGPPDKGSGRGKQAAGVLSDEFASGHLRGYDLTLQCTQDRLTYQVSAQPTSAVGHRTYCADQDGVIRTANDATATACLSTGEVLR